MTNAAAEDLDADGDLDVVTHNWGEGDRRLFENTTNKTETAAHWVRIAPVFDGRTARGVRSDLELPGRRITRTLTATARNVATLPSVHFGLGTYDGPVTAHVYFPDGFVVRETVHEIDREVPISR